MRALLPIICSVVISKSLIHLPSQKGAPKFVPAPVQYQHLTLNWTDPDTNVMHTIWHTYGGLGGTIRTPLTETAPGVTSCVVAVTNPLTFALVDTNGNFIGVGTNIADSFMVSSRDIDWTHDQTDTNFPNGPWATK